MQEQSKGLTRTGVGLSALVGLGLAMSALMKLSQHPKIVENFGHFGYSPSALVPIGVVELLCVLLYAIPQTAVLGAVLVTGYLGGAVSTHVRAGDGFAQIAPAILLGVLAWAGLFCRDARVRSLLPLRS